MITSENNASSRRVAFDDGMTGGGYVVAVEDEAEVEGRVMEFVDELRPSGSVGLTLVRRAASMAVRMERCAERQIAAVADRVIQAIADFVPPEGYSDAEIAQLRNEAARIAAFDPSHEACLARRYEAAAERSFYRALKEFRLVEKEAKRSNPAPTTPPPQPRLGSFFPGESIKSVLDSLPPLSSPLPVMTNRITPIIDGFDLPIAIGRRR